MEPELYQIASSLRGNDSVPYVDRMRAEAPNDEQFQLAFKIAEVPRQATARYLLREIENAKRSTGELRIQGSAKVHLEHIYPQKPREEHRDSDLDAMLNRLGNLTLLSARINREAKNAPFSEKKPKYIESQLLITKELCDFDEWNVASIEQRQSKLAEDSTRIWVFPS